MRTREQRWAARSARGWPRLRVHAVLNGVGALLIGSALLWFTHGPLKFQNFPAGDVAWVWRVVTLFLAVLLPFVLATMGVYLVFAGATATNRAALAAGRARTVVLNPDDTDGAPVTDQRLSEHTPPGVKIRAHALHGRQYDSRYSRDLLGLLAIQSPVALAPLGVGLVVLLVATIYYSTGYAEPATVLLLGMLYLGWKLFRGWRSHRVFAGTRWEVPAETDADTGPVPRVTPLREDEFPRQRGHRSAFAEDDDAAAPARRDREWAASASAYHADHDDPEEAYETTDELPVVEQIRDRYAEPRRQSASQRRLAERAEREAVRRRLPRVVQAERADTDATAPISRMTAADGRTTTDPATEAAEQEQQRQNQMRYEDHMQRHREKREDRLRRAEAREPEEAPSLIGYAMNRFKRRGDGR